MATINPLVSFSNELARAVETGARSLVAVHGRPHVPSSGILWQAGVVVTTHHTLRRNEDITVTLPDGTDVAATVAGRDAGTDLAVLRVAPEYKVEAKFADEASIKAGNLVLALGRRDGNAVSVSFGVAGAVERFIRPDVSIFTGFSGGALVDAEGQIIGVNTSALARGSGITVPASMVSGVVADLLAGGHVRRGYIGVGFHPVQLPDGREGLIILSLEPNGPAASAGVLVGDVLLSLEGQPVTDTDDVQAHLGSDRIGKPIAAGLLRGGAPLEVQIVPAERPAPAEQHRRGCR